MSNMAVNHASITTHVPQSLPSFAQAFSNSSLGGIPSTNSLPPIQTRLSAMDNHHRVNSPSSNPRSRPSSEENSASSKVAGRKRNREDSKSNAREEDRSDSERSSPKVVRIKEEQDQDMLDPTPPPTPSRQVEHRVIHDTGGAPPPSTLLPSPSKKRRVTISGGPHPLNTDVRAPTDQTNSTPISPVVMGFTIQRDNPSAIEQVRSMITVKQKQKALIEQRRGSVVGLMSPATGPGNQSAVPSTDERPPPPPPQSSAAKTQANTRAQRRSPNTGTAAAAAGSRRLTLTTQLHQPLPPGPMSAGPRPPSPSPIIVPSQQPTQLITQTTPMTQSLLPPPISFARRRAGQLGQGKRKPADITISPRDAQTQEQFQPAIQSAPPIPQGGQGTFYSGRFPMTLPRVPSVMGVGDNVRRVAVNVPPTPTRLSMQRTVSSSGLSTQPISGISGRSPPGASVPIASTLVPPTPSSLHHPGYSGDKTAFLAPFEVFYDALNDSKQLKNWLGEQLQRSTTLMQQLTQQQEKMNELVDSLVEKKVSGMRSEMSDLQRRVEELEESLRLATGRRSSVDVGPRQKGKQPLRNGISGPMVSDSYTFPPSTSSESSKLRTEAGRPSSAWNQNSDTRDNQSAPNSENGSPIPFDARRLSVSATRLDPPRSDGPPPRGAFAIQSPPLGFREASQGGHAKVPRTERDRSNLRPPSSLSRPSSQQQERHSSPPPPPRRSGSRRNSIVMSPPDAPNIGAEET